MKRLQKAALLTAFVEKLSKKGSTRIHGLKPHVSVKESKSAIETLDTIMREAEELDLG